MKNTPIRKNREPFFNDVPRGVLALGGSLVIIETLLQVLGVEWRSKAFLLLAFFPIEFSTPYKELFFGQNFTMFFSYAFLHGDFFHMVINPFSWVFLKNDIFNISPNNNIVLKRL